MSFIEKNLLNLQHLFQVFGQPPFTLDGVSFSFVYPSTVSNAKRKQQPTLDFTSLQLRYPTTKVEENQLKLLMEWKCNLQDQICFDKYISSKIS